MRRFPVLLTSLLLCSLASLALAQKPASKAKPQPSRAPAAAPGGAPPQFRPSVLGSGPDSLVNRIDSQALLDRGQKDGAVMFAAMVKKDGSIEASWTYRGMPGTAALEEEVNKQLAETKFTPAIYEHQPVGVMLYGTVVFSAEGTPHLHIFLNQDGEEIKRASDFIGPQPVVGADSQFDGLRLPPLENPIAMTAIVDLRVKVDAQGKLEGTQLLAEDPPLLGFAAAANAALEGAKFIPAFRNGDPAPADTVMALAYKIVPDDEAEPE